VDAAHLVLAVDGLTDRGRPLTADAYLAAAKDAHDRLATSLPAAEPASVGGPA
jgi:hypothetical protein